MRAGVVLLVALACACHSRAPQRAPGETAARGSAAGPGAPFDPLDALRGFEEARRAATDFAHLRPSDTALGADPYVIRAIRALPSADRDPAAAAGSVAAPRFLGLLRGRSALVELDGSLREVARWPAPASPTGMALTGSGEVLVVGELASVVARYRPVRGKLERGKLEAVGSIELPGVRAMRDVATGPEGVVYVVEEHDGRLLTLEPRAAPGAAPPVARTDTNVCRGPIHVKRVGHAVLVDCLLDHAIVVRDVDARGRVSADVETRITHDGPMWGFDALDDASGLLVAVGGVEDHPLDRTEGSFGFVDSFVTLYRIEHGAALKLTEVNTSALGVITPKALVLTRVAPETLELAVAGYGSDRLAFLRWKSPVTARPTSLEDPTVEIRPIPPGAAMMEGLPDGTFAVADPLLDAWVRVGRTTSAVVHVEDEASLGRLPPSRLGEALFFTTLMAPWDTSEGRLSRFTCETCHFEGYVDGRTHRTGRGDIRATTKPLLGLFNNRPYFSRALDADLTTMVDNEFRVAGAKSGHDSWFSLSQQDVPWIRELGIDQAELGPEALRRALMTFLMTFTHRPNPSVVGRSRWTDTERVGAQKFREQCESCHQARLVTDEPSTRLPFAEWEERTMAREGAIVWASPDYAKTGVLPYVNESGARVVSLRRLYKKHPYFTNGSAGDIGAVLSRARTVGDHFLHDGAPAEGASALGEQDKTALAAFLDLL